MPGRSNGMTLQLSVVEGGWRGGVRGSCLTGQSESEDPRFGSRYRGNSLPRFR